MDNNPNFPLIADMYMELPVGVVLYDSSGGIVECNDTACNLFGYSQAEMQSLNYEDLLPDILPSKTRREMFTSEGFLWVVQRRKDGVIFECEHNTKHLTIKGSHYCLTLYRSADNNEPLMITNQFIHADLPMIASTFCILTWQEIEGEMRLIGYNTILKDMTKGRIQDYIGRTIHELYDQRGFFNQSKWIQEVYESQGIIKGESECDFLLEDYMRLVDCVYLYVQPDLVIQLAEDSTDRRLAVSALHESEERFKALYLSNPSPVLTWKQQSGKFYLVDHNHAMDAFTQGKIKELVGTSSDIFFSQYTQLSNDIKTCYENKAIIRSDMHMNFLMDNEKRYLTFTCAYVPGDLILMHMNDVTEQRQSELDLIRYQRQLSDLYEQNLNTLERERHRISQELHDGVGQYLSTIKFSIENLLINQESYKDAGIIDEQLRANINLLKEAIMDVSKISMDLRPSILDDLGLIATINWFLREFGKVYKDIKVQKILAVDESEVPQAIKIVMYRILQESMNNIAKHSEATAVRIRLSKTDRFLEFVIEDNGNGFNVEEVQKSRGGLGIAGMRERVTFAQGKFVIDSIMGGGTRIQVSWPLGTDQTVLNSISNQSRSAG